MSANTDSRKIQPWFYLLWDEERETYIEFKFETFDEYVRWSEKKIDEYKKKIDEEENPYTIQRYERVIESLNPVNQEISWINYFKKERTREDITNLGFRVGRKNLEKEASCFWEYHSALLTTPSNSVLDDCTIRDGFRNELLTAFKEKTIKDIQAYEAGYQAGLLAYQKSFKKKIEDLLEPFFERIYNQLVTLDKLLTKYHIFINAHYYFFVSVILLGLALLLQNGGNWQQMALLNSPIVFPGFDPIPFTASISFPFALLGWIENPAGAVLSSASAASTNVILALFASAAGLFFFAANRIQLSAVGVRPEFALLAFALFWVSVFFDVALHWHSAPVLPPALILFNRAFAVLALGVSLFWRNAAKRGKDVPGADGEYIKACDAAEQTARKIGLWLLGLVWLATQLSHANLSPVAFYWVKFAMISAFIAIPLRLMIQFKLDFQKALGRYNQLLDLWQQSYKPPPTVATDAQVRDALNGGCGIGGKDWNDTGE